MADWYYAQGTVQRGPVPMEFLIDSLRSGVLRRDDLVWREGLTDWTQAGQMAELAGAWRASMPPRLPPTATMGPTSSAPLHPPIAPSPSAAPQPHMPGAALGQRVSPIVRSPHAGLAMASLVLGVVAFALLPLGSMLGVPGLICGIIALRGMKQTGAAENRGMAIAGVVLGIFWAIVGAMVLAAVALYFALQPAIDVSVNSPTQNVRAPFSIRP